MTRQFGLFGPDPAKSDDPLLDSGSDLHGSFSGGHKCDDGVSIALLLTTLAAIAVSFFILFTTITMGNGRRRRRAADGEEEEDSLESKRVNKLNLFTDVLNYGRNQIFLVMVYVYCIDTL